MLLYITEGNAPLFNGREKLVQFFISNLKVFQRTSLRFHTYDHHSIFFIHAKIHDDWNCLQMGSSAFKASEGLGNADENTSTASPVILWFDLNKIATEIIFVIFLHVDLLGRSVLLLHCVIYGIRAF